MHKSVFGACANSVACVFSAVLVAGCGGGDSSGGEVVTITKLASRPVNQSSPPVEQVVARELAALHTAGASTAGNASCQMRWQAQPLGTFFMMVDVSASQLAIARQLNFAPVSEYTDTSFSVVPCANL